MKRTVSALLALLLLLPCSLSLAETAATTTVSAELDYAKGIAEGVYGWTLSEDGSYYMLSAVNADGTPVASAAQSTGFGGHIGTGGGTKGDRGQLPEGDVPTGMQGDRGQLPEGEMPAGMQGDRGQLPEGDAPAGMQGDRGQLPEGEMPAGMQGGMASDADPLAMEQNAQASTQAVNAQGVYTEANITNTEYQTMLVFVPSAYLTLNADGSATFTDAQVGLYTAATAPIVFQNNNGGWRSGSPKAPEYTDCLAAGMIYVSCGSRSRDASAEDGTSTGKAPTPVADLKAGVIALRANSDVIPGDMERIISVGASGGGQMSSALGASGNMEAYYPYLYENGAIGVTYDAATDTYASTYSDAVYGTMAYCPIADIENADLAYAWMRYDSTVDESGAMDATAGSYSFSAFQLALQEDAAYAFAEYINGLGLVDASGTVLTFAANDDGTLNLRAGTYYDAVLNNISDALNAYLAQVEDGAAYLSQTYGDTSAWLAQNDDGTYAVTDLAGFIRGTGLTRNKDIPGFDTFDLSAENNAFGASDVTAVHYAASVATLLQSNYDKYAALDGFDAAQVALYIQNALTGEEAADIAEQTYLVNATQILLDAAQGEVEVDASAYWRTRNGTADPHTSFSVAYDICLTAAMAGYDADYALVWAMGHGSNEGTSTGTLVDWINRICAE